jgi:hypothetical protein
VDGKCCKSLVAAQGAARGQQVARLQHQVMTLTSHTTAHTQLKKKTLDGLGALPRHQANSVCTPGNLRGQPPQKRAQHHTTGAP